MAFGASGAVVEGGLRSELGGDYFPAQRRLEDS